MKNVTNTNVVATTGAPTSELMFVCGCGYCDVNDCWNPKWVPALGVKIDLSGAPRECMYCQGEQTFTQDGRCTSCGECG